MKQCGIIAIPGARLRAMGKKALHFASVREAADFFKVDYKVVYNELYAPPKKASTITKTGYYFDEELDECENV